MAIAPACGVPVLSRIVASTVKLPALAVATSAFHSCGSTTARSAGSSLNRKSIAASKQIAENFATVVNQYVLSDVVGTVLRCDVTHVDGTFNALVRNSRHDWLPADLPDAHQSRRPPPTPRPKPRARVRAPDRTG